MMTKYLCQFLLLFKYLNRHTKGILVFLLFSSHLSMATEDIYYTGQPIDFANINIASLFIQEPHGDFSLKGSELNNKTAFKLYQGSGTYQLKIHFFIQKQTQDIWLQLRTKQTYQKVSINGLILTQQYIPLNRLLLPKNYLTHSKNELIIEFSILDDRKHYPFLDIAIATAENFHQQSNHYSIASVSFASLFLVIFLALLCCYVFLATQLYIVLTAVFYLMATLVTAFSALFWLQELPTYLYNETPNILGYLMGLSFFIMNLCVMHIRLRKQVYLLIISCAILYALSLPYFLGFTILIVCISISKFAKEKNYFYVAMLCLVCSFTAIDQFNTVDPWIQAVDSLILKSFLYQLEYLALSLFFIYLLISFANNWQEKTQSHLKLQVQKQSLELHLINKHIQPHFLMNALMSIQQQIDTSPSDAIDMIELLSEEFCLLHRHIGKQLVPLKDEITMCESLLNFMSKQQQTHYQLVLQIDYHTLMIPAGVLHTFIENGIKHGFKGTEPGIFTITVNTHANDLKLCIENNGATNHSNKTYSGLGLKYVKQQLEMWQPNKWQLCCEPTNNGWMNSILITDFLSAK